MDILLPIDTSVIDTQPNGERIHSPKAAQEFYECNSQLLDNMKAELTANAAPGKR